MSGEVEKLAQALREEEDKHAAEADVKRAELSKLKELLRRLKQDTMLTLRYARKEAAAKTESLARGYGADEEDVEAAIEELRGRIETEALVHEQSMGVLKGGEAAAGGGLRGLALPTAPPLARRARRALAAG